MHAPHSCDVLTSLGAELRHPAGKAFTSAKSASRHCVRVLRLRLPRQGSQLSGLAPSVNDCQSQHACELGHDHCPWLANDAADSDPEDSQWRVGVPQPQDQAKGWRPHGTQHALLHLANPFYKGIIRLKSGESFKGAYPPMVTVEEWERGQEILGRLGRPRPVDHDFASAGLLRCASCGRALVSEVHVKPSGKRYVYYRCHRHGNHGRCSEAALPEHRFIDQLAADLRHMSLSPEAAAWINDAVERSLQTETHQLTTAKQSLQDALTAAQREEEVLLDLRIRETIEDSVFARRMSALQDRRAHLHLKLDEPTRSPQQLLGRLGRALDFSVSGPEMLANGTRVQQRQILETVGSNWRVTGGKVLYEAKKPFSLIDERTACLDWWALAEDVRTWLFSSEDPWLPNPVTSFPIS